MRLLVFLAQIVLLAASFPFDPNSDTHGKAIAKCRAAAEKLPNLPSSIKNRYVAMYGDECGNWVGDTATDPFYKTPTDFSKHTPGDVLKFEEVTPEGLLQHYDQFPPGVTLYRMFYVSTNHKGTTVPASAFVLLPYGRTPWSDPFKIIVWAHGTSGDLQQCAPSNERNLYYEWSAPFSMAIRGYAVIAPDYAGLGTDTTFHYLDGPSHAADVGNAVIAMRRLQPHQLPRGLLTYEWVVVGHSEGGLVAWATNEREETTPTGGFLGAVSLAPALQNLKIINYGLSQKGSYKSLFYSSYTFTAIANFYKMIGSGGEKVPTEDALYTSAGIERKQFGDKGCIDTAEAVFADLDFDKIYKSSWLKEKWATDWQRDTSPSGDKALAAPLLLVLAGDDHAAWPSVAEDVFSNFCDKHPDARARLSMYPKLDHDPVTFASQAEYFDWIDDRFRGVVLPSGCVNATVDTPYSGPATSKISTTDQGKITVVGDNVAIPKVNPNTQPNRRSPTKVYQGVTVDDLECPEGLVPVSLPLSFSQPDLSFVTCVRS